jgi:hypothetical protein
VSRTANILAVNAPAGGRVNGALSFPGVQAETYFSGGAFSVDGRDYALNDSLSGAKDKDALYGLATGDPALYPGREAAIEASLASGQQSQIIGKDQTRQNDVTNGRNTVAGDAGLSSQAVVDFVAAVKKYADIDLYSDKTKGGLSYTNVGSTCATNANDPNCWGTVAAPKIVYVHGDFDPTSQFNALKVGGTSSGAGILIVEDGDFTVNDTFRWVGLVIVTGKYVGVGLMGGGAQEILGALISNETASDEAVGFYEGVVVGNVMIRYSRAALNTALTALARRAPVTAGASYIVTMSSWQEK